MYKYVIVVTLTKTSTIGRLYKPDGQRRVRCMKGSNDYGIDKKQFDLVKKLGKEPTEDSSELTPDELEGAAGGEIQFVPDDYEGVSDLFKIERYVNGYCPYCYCDHEIIQTKYTMDSTDGIRSMYFCSAAQQYFFSIGDYYCSADGEPLSLTY